MNQNKINSYLAAKRESDLEIEALFNQFKSVVENRKKLAALGDEIWQSARQLAAREVEILPHNSHFSTGSYMQNALTDEAIQILRDSGLWPLDGYEMKHEDLTEHSLLDAINVIIQVTKIGKPKPQYELVKQPGGSYMMQRIS